MVADDVIREVLQVVAGELAAQTAAAGLEVLDALHALAAVACGENDGGSIDSERVGAGGFDGQLGDAIDGGAIHGGFLW